MQIDKNMFGYCAPPQSQIDRMEVLREMARVYAATVDELIPDGPDKTFIIRELRTLAMWANVAVTRQADGSPRGEI